jgi:hypothetical protein
VKEVAVLLKSRITQAFAEKPGQFQPAWKGLGRIWTRHTHNSNNGRMACNNSGSKAVKQSKDWRIRKSNNGQRNPQWCLSNMRVERKRAEKAELGNCWRLRLMNIIKVIQRESQSQK